MRKHLISFDGAVLERGFWLYVWRIEAADRTLVYVGRTGDSSSPNASSPFRRIGQHLDERPNAKGNSLHRRLAERGIDPRRCHFTMTALGPLFPEQDGFELHKPVRDGVAALEKELALWFSERGYTVLGSHAAPTEADPEMLREIVGMIDADFPPC